MGSKRADVFRDAFSQFAFESSESTEIYRTFVLDLAPSLEELRTRLDAKWRNKLKQAERNGLTVISETGAEAYQTFCEMYLQMRRRKTFETTVDVNEFGKHPGKVGESTTYAHFDLPRQRNPYCGPRFFGLGQFRYLPSWCHQRRRAHLEGRVPLQWTLIRFLKENGIRFYDLGGIDPAGNPGVYQFKRGLSGADVCQTKPLIASNSVLSTAMTKVALGMQRSIRASRKPFSLTRGVRRPAAVE